MDTKWKIIKKDVKNYNISASDMYQMYVYAKKYDTKEVWLLYPAIDQLSGKIDYFSDDEVTVNIFLINLFKINDSMTNLLDIVNNGS